MLGFDLSALCLQPSELVMNAFSFRWCVSFFFVGFAVFLDLAFPLGKLTVVLLHYGFCLAVGCHKDLHIGITVCFQCVGNFVQFISDFPFGLLYLRFQRFTLLTLEDALCFGKLLLKLRQNLILQVLDFFCLILQFYHQVTHMTELCHIDIQCRLGRHTLFTDKVLQKILCPAHDTAEQVGKSTTVTDRLADFFVDLRLLNLQYRFLRNACDQCHIRRLVPLLPCGVVRFDFFLFRIILADFFGRQIHTVLIKHFQSLLGI